MQIYPGDESEVNTRGAKDTLTELRDLSKKSNESLITIVATLDKILKSVEELTNTIKESQKVTHISASSSYPNPNAPPPKPVQNNLPANNLATEKVPLNPEIRKRIDELKYGRISGIETTNQWIAGEELPSDKLHRLGLGG